MSRKSFVAVICEYNPFHFGHRHQINELKKSFDGVACIMSGNIVQRGSVAIADKYIRAEAALKSGADLVLELPVPWCCASAREFAKAGVHIAAKMKLDSLAFGAESGMETLLALKRFTESEACRASLASLNESSRNLSYPQAMTKLISDSLGKEYALAFKKPNNILSLEYLSALDGTNLSPFVIKREQSFKSSSEIRASGDGSKILSLLPEESASVFRKELNKAFPRDARALDSFFVGALRQRLFEGRRQENLYLLTDDLENKILFSAVKQSSLEGIVFDCTDKTYTAARVRRAINSLVFGIKATQVQAMPAYTTVLAANAVGCEFLRSVKKTAEIDILNKPSRALALGGETKSAFEFAKYVEDIISLADPVPSPADTAKNPIILGENL